MSDNVIAGLPIGELKRIRLKPGERLIFQCKEPLTREWTERMAKDLSGLFDSPVLVVGPEWNVTVAEAQRPAADAEEADAQNDAFRRGVGDVRKEEALR